MCSFLCSTLMKRLVLNQNHTRWHVEKPEAATGGQWPDHREGTWQCDRWLTADWSTCVYFILHQWPNCNHVMWPNVKSQMTQKHCLNVLVFSWCWKCSQLFKPGGGAVWHSTPAWSQRHSRYCFKVNIQDVYERWLRWSLERNISDLLQD